MAGESRLISIRISWRLPCGPAMRAAGGVPERSFFAVGFVSAPAGWFPFVSPGELLVGLFDVCCLSRRGLTRVVLRGTLGGFVWWLVVCQGRLAEPDGSGAFFV
jgi:hypothetical protein